MAVFQDFQEITAFGGDQNRQPPVIKDEQIGARDGFQQPGMPPSPLAMASASKRRGAR